MVSSISAQMECNYVASTETAPDLLSFTFTNGTFESYGCAGIDPTYWLYGSTISVTINFVTPQNPPSIRVWGMNPDDFAAVSVNGVAYPLNDASAAYDVKTVCGISPGDNGIVFLNGMITGGNDTAEGNYSYQNLQLFATNVSSITLYGISGAGWGFAGVSVDCPLLASTNEISRDARLYPNPFSESAVLSLERSLRNGQLYVHNSQGQLISKKSINGSIVIIERDVLPEGIYIYSILEENEFITSQRFTIID